MSQALYPSPNFKQPARALVHKGEVYVPKDPPSKFTVGPGTWFEDEGHLSVKSPKGDEITVYAPEDPQIMFPPAETWVRRSSLHRSLWDEVLPMNPGDMIKAGADVERVLMELLKDGPEAWESLDVDYEPPRVERLWRQWEGYRINLHRIHPCKKALYHPHPWAAYIRMLSGTCEMGIAYSSSMPKHEILERGKEVAKVLLTKGSAYEMINPYGWHYVKPLDKPTLSLMVTVPPWNPPVFVHDDFGKAADLKPLTTEAKSNLLKDFREAFMHWRAST